MGRWVGLEGGVGGWAGGWGWRVVLGGGVGRVGGVGEWGRELVGTVKWQ